MANYFYLLLVLVAFCYAEEKIGAEVQVVKSIEEYLSTNPDAKVVPLQIVVGPLQTLHYVFGNRVKGDTLVAERSQYFGFPKTQDFDYKFWYPDGGLGARVSMVDVWVDQTSNVGSAYIVAGGIGKRSITVLITAKNTVSFKYTARVYGY